jgi:hypothetical protein
VGKDRSKEDADGQDMGKEEATMAKVDAIRQAGHRTFATGFLLSMVAIFALVPFLASPTDSMRKHTWALVDMCICTFVAALWFMVIVRGLADFNLRGPFVSAAHFLTSFLLLVVVIHISWWLKGDELRQMSWNAQIAPIVKWFTIAGMHEAMQDNPQWYVVLFAVAYAFMLVVTMRLFKPQKGFGDPIENAVVGAAIASVMSLLFITLVCGEFHEMYARRIRTSRAEEWEVITVIAGGCFFLALAIVCIPLLPRLKNRRAGNYWWERMCDVIAVCLTMMPCFTITVGVTKLLCEVYGAGDSSIDSRLKATAICLFIALGIVFLCSKLPYLRADTADATAINTVLLTVVGFIVGFQFTHLLENSMRGGFEQAGTATQVQLLITLGISAIIIPVYIMYIKPMVVRESKPSPRGPPEHQKIQSQGAR